MADFFKLIGGADPAVDSLGKMLQGIGHDLRDVEQSAGVDADIITMLRTRAALGNTVADTGTLGPIALIGTGDDNLPPPTVPQPPAGGNYNGYVEILGMSQIYAAGELSIVASEMIIGAAGAGDYRTTHAWIDMSTDTNANIVGFIFGILKADTGLISFSPRVAGERSSAQNQATNISGGGFAIGLEAGDKLSVWVAASQNSNVTIFDTNMGLEMSIPASLKA